jgi:hypothetical protein
MGLRRNKKPAAQFASAGLELNKSFFKLSSEVLRRHAQRIVVMMKMVSVGHGQYHDGSILRRLCFAVNPISQPCRGRNENLADHGFSAICTAPNQS